MHRDHMKASPTHRRWTVILGVCALLIGCHVLPIRDARGGGSPEPGHEAHQRLNEALNGLKSYAHGDSREPVRKVMRLAYEAAEDSELHEELTARMADMLHGKATIDAKKTLCEALGVAGTPGQARALAGLLDHEQLSFRARSALARIPGSEVSSRLRDTLSDASGKVAAGIIATLGRRGDERAVDAIADRLNSDHREVAAAAVRALGRIGTHSAAHALQQARPDLPAGLRNEVDHALLLRAEALRKADNNLAAPRLYEELRKPGRPVSVRAAAVEGLLACTDEGHAELLNGILRGEEALRDAMLHRLDQMVSREVLSNLVETLTQFPAPVQTSLIETVARRELKSAQDAVCSALDSSPDTVHTVALRALGRIGDASAVPRLVEHLDREVARQSLVRLTGQGVNEAIIDALQKADAGASRRHLIKVLEDRGASSAASALLQVAENGKPRSRLAAFRALGKLSTTEHLPQLIRLLKHTEKNMRAPAQQALIQSARRAKNREEAVRSILNALPDLKDGAEYRALLPALGQLGGPQALKAVRRALESGPDATADTALNVLADWPTGAALDDLLGVARSTDSSRDRLVALRGFARVARRDENRSPAKLTDMFAEAFKIAQTAQEKKALLGAMQSAPTPEAVKLAKNLLNEKSIHTEAALAVLQLSEVVAETHRGSAVSALQEVARTTDSASTFTRAISALKDLSAGRNLAADATASSPDGLAKDGNSGGDAAGIDGNPETYWDEEDNKDLYRYRLTFPEPRTVSVITVRGYQHENFAPRDFTILCDGEVVRKVRDASYRDNLLMVRLEATQCGQLELKITGSYGASPAIRELSIYHIPE